MLPQTSQLDQLCICFWLKNAFHVRRLDIFPYRHHITELLGPNLDVVLIFPIRFRDHEDVWRLSLISVNNEPAGGEGTEMFALGHICVESVHIDDRIQKKLVKVFAIFT